VRGRRSGKREEPKREQRKGRTGFEGVFDAKEESLREDGLRDLRLHSLFVKVQAQSAVRSCEEKAK
jgi:hypothetical protein